MDKGDAAGMTRRVRLVGDGVENPANARALMDAAAMFGVQCAFRDTRGLMAAWDVERGGELELIDTPGLLDQQWPIVAVETNPQASIVFGATLPGTQSSIIVGGERLGIRADLLRAAARTVRIPMSGRGINTLNVAAAAAVALYYLIAGRGLAPRLAKRPEERRPALLLSRPQDHVEAGSAIRSAAAFGWRTVGLDDSSKVWYGVSHVVAAEGRAAARSHRNRIRVLPMTTSTNLAFRRVVVAGALVDGPPIHRVDLAGHDTLLVIPDERKRGSIQRFKDLGASLEPARIDISVPGFPYRYRLMATIVMAEAVRQIGFRPAGQPRQAPRRGLTYESTLSTVATGAAEEIDPAVLKTF